jgi:hypothetical protein
VTVNTGRVPSQEAVMKSWFTFVRLAFIALAVVAVPAPARAHCDAIDGPVASAAVRALDQRNVNLVLPYVAAESEAELVAAYGKAAAVRSTDSAAREVADRWFMETAVRLHRAGEKAPYTGLKPAGQDHGPAIRAAERALQSGKVAPVLDLLSQHVEHGIVGRFGHAAHAPRPAGLASHADVAQARERVRAELGFIEYVEHVYRAVEPAQHGH